MQLLDFLKHKGQEYAPFDPRRAGRIFESILDSEISQSCAFNYLSSAKFIHLIGTNGKGSTGRFCALALMQQGYKVLHFTSPHLFKFNERFFGNAFLDSQNSENVSDKELECAHNFLQKFKQISESSYFEYATFLALVLAQNADFVVFEAGLGGEFDSTSSVIAKMIERKILKTENILSVFTPIGIDHADFLGENIENIAATKLRAMSKNAILAPQKFAQTTRIARQIAKDFGANLFEISESKNLNSEILDSENELEKYAKKHNLAPFLKQNLITAFFASRHFKIAMDFQNLPALNLRGRCEIIKNVLLDVGHNVECANALSAAIQAFGFENATLIYNTYADKNAAQILKILKPFIKNVLILNVENPRIIDIENLRQILKNLEIEFADFEPKNFKNDEKYIVFGSFSVVAQFLVFGLV